MAVNFAGLGPCTPGDAEWHRRLDVALADDGPIEWFWMSFVHTDLPEPPEDQMVPGGGRFAGLCILPAPNEIVAGQLAWALGCNPGGQIAFYPACPPGWRPRAEYVGKLFTGDDAVALGQLELSEFCDSVT